MWSRPDPEALTVRAVSALAVAAFTGCMAVGVILAAVYRPHQSSGLRVLHAGAAAVGLISAIAAVIVARSGRVGVSRKGAFFVVGMVLLVGGALTTGSSLAWTGGAPEDRGVLLSGTNRVLVSGKVVSGNRVALTFVVHAVLSLGAVAVFGWAISRHRRRGKCQTDSPVHP